MTDHLSLGKSRIWAHRDICSLQPCQAKQQQLNGLYSMNNRNGVRVNVEDGSFYQHSNTCISQKPSLRHSGYTFFSFCLW